MYTYTPLSSHGTIRVLDLESGSEKDDIHGSLREIELPDHDDGAESVPIYSALSYTWGSPLDARSLIWIDDDPFEVRPNLFAALTALRDPTRIRTLWIDALCINQNDVFERNDQVALMARIYRMADSVEVWLGEADRLSETGFEYIRRLAAADSSGESDTAEDSTSRGHSIFDGTRGGEMVRAIDSILKRDYWSRAWIIQEVSLALTITIQCGASRLSWDDFAAACLSLPKRPSCNTLALHLINQRDDVLHGNDRSLRQTLESLIRKYYGCNCSDKRDRIFAFISLASDCASNQGLRADYRLTRLDLMLRTLEFCGPADPVDFISILFKALTKDDGDGLWQGARNQWEAARSSPPDFSIFSDGGSMSDGEVVKITQFVAAVSSTKDWARYYSFFAFRQQTSSLLAGPIKEHDDPNQFFDSQKQHNTARRVSQWDMMMNISPRHLVIMSANQSRAAANICTSLNLHESSSKCNLRRCVRLSTT